MILEEWKRGEREDERLLLVDKVRREEGYGSAVGGRVVNGGSEIGDLRRSLGNTCGRYYSS